MRWRVCHPSVSPTLAFEADSRGRPRIMSEARSASMIVGAFRLAFGVLRGDCVAVEAR